jgi:Arc/MetJ family transcription regulator
MKTTIDIPIELIEDVRRSAGVRTKRDAVILALEDYRRRRRASSLKDLLGTFDDFMTADELRAERDES